MKTSLAHLPETKQNQIRHITEVIKEVANPEKIILFGSHAKGNFVEHRYTGRDGIRYEYISDYDILVVTRQNNIKEYELDDIVMSRTKDYSPSINIQLHEIDYINEGLEFGQYFFSDIVNEGVLLYDTGNVKFAKPRELTPLEEKQIAQNYFDIWFPLADEFLYVAENTLNDGKPLKNNKLRVGAFNLHQSTESLYYATLLVFTGYKPKTHNLMKLRKLSKHLSEDLFLVFPVETDKKEKNLFELLKRAYIDARYKTTYVITADEFATLIERGKKMKDIVERICKEKIASY